VGGVPPPLGLLEQARVVDCDGGLVAEGLEKDNFPRREYTLGLIADGEHAEHRLRDPKRHGENRANAGGLLPTPKVLGRKRPRPEGVADHRSSFDDGLARDPDARWKEMSRLEGITGTPGASDREQRAIGLQKTEDRGWDSQKEQDRFGDPIGRRRDVEALGQEACNPSEFFRLVAPARGLGIQPSVLQRQRGVVGKRPREPEISVIERSPRSLEDDGTDETPPAPDQ